MIYDVILYLSDFLISFRLRHELIFTIISVIGILFFTWLVTKSIKRYRKIIICLFFIFFSTVFIKLNSDHKTGTCLLIDSDNGKFYALVHSRRFDDGIYIRSNYVLKIGNFYSFEKNFNRLGNVLDISSVDKEYCEKFPFHSVKRIKNE